MKNNLLRKLLFHYSFLDQSMMSFVITKMLAVFATVLFLSLSSSLFCFLASDLKLTLTTSFWLDSAMSIAICKGWLNRFYETERIILVGIKQR